MLSFFIAAIPALLMWEFVSIKLNIRLPVPLRKRLFRIGTRFALLALVVETLEDLVPLSGYLPVTHGALKALTAAVPEEIVKMIGVYRIGRRELDEIGPGIAILLAVGVSLGFAVLENRLYVLHGGLGVWLVRAFTAVPMHAIFGLVMGGFMALAWRDYRRTDPVCMALALIVPITFHFSYDFLIMTGGFTKALYWPHALLPCVMLVEGIFALLLINVAMNGATAIYGARIRSDPTGKRAAILGVCMFLIVGCLIALDLELPHVTSLPALAAMPLVLAVDMSLLALVRFSPG